MNHKDALALWLTNEYGDAVVPEFRFHPTRKWRFDFALPDYKVAIEFDGLFGGGAHTSINMVVTDSEKINEAQLHGWIVIRTNTPNLRDSSGYQAIERAVNARKESAA